MLNSLVCVAEGRLDGSAFLNSIHTILVFTHGFGYSNLLHEMMKNMQISKSLYLLLESRILFADIYTNVESYCF